MIAKAQELNPGIVIRVGSMAGLPERDRWGGIVALYSVIHVPRGEQVAMSANWRSALRPGGLVPVWFHLGTEDRYLDEFFGQRVSIDFFFCMPAEVAERLAVAGFVVIDTHERDPYPDVEATNRRAYLLACQPA